MVRKDKPVSPRGLTLTELMTAVVLLVITATVAYNLYIFAKDMWAYVYVKGDLQDKAMLGLEKMIHGVDRNHKGIQEAQGASLPTAGSSGSKIAFIDGEDASLSREFYLSGDSVIYKSASGSTSFLIENDVETLTFTRPADMANLIIINLALRRIVSGREVSISLKTEIELRNM